MLAFDVLLPKIGVTPRVPYRIGNMCGTKFCKVARLCMRNPLGDTRSVVASCQVLFRVVWVWLQHQTALARAFTGTMA